MFAFVGKNHASLPGPGIVVSSQSQKELAMRMRSLRGLWLAALLGVSTSGAAPGAAGAESLLADAIQSGDKQAALALLSTHTDVNAAQSDGATALHWAAYLDDADTTARLLKAGARVDAANNYGVTPLSLACGNGSAGVIDQLLKGGADPNRPVRSGETPLMLAARSGN